MDDWVDQVYISTKDFVPLLQNALMSQEEWCRLLEKEQNDPVRFGESEEAYDKRLKETPSETLTRVVGGEVVECFKAAVNVWRGGAGRAPKCEDMPETDYPHLHKWLLSHVNRAPSTKLRFLRHSQQNSNEEAMRNQVKTMCWKYLEAEVKALREGEAGEFEGGVSRFDAMVEELDQEIDETYFDHEGAREAREDGLRELPWQDPAAALQRGARPRRRPRDPRPRGGRELPQAGARPAGGTRRDCRAVRAALQTQGLRLQPQVRRGPSARPGCWRVRSA